MDMPLTTMRKQADDRHRPLRAGDPVRLDSMACLSIRRPAMECGLCREICPAAVLGGGLWTLTMDKAGCLGCGLCAAACPTGALVVDGTAPEAAPEAEPLVLECRRVPEAERAEGAVVVPCLGGLTAPDLLDLLADGTERIVLRDRGLCAGCGVAAEAAPWEGQVSAALEVLAAAVPEGDRRIAIEGALLDPGVALPVIELRPELKPTRRDFFRRLTAPAPEPHSPEESQRIVHGRGLVAPVARERILAAAERLSDAVGAPKPAALMPAVTIAAEACDLHGVCAAICPTGALRLTDDGTTMAIDYDAAACIGCNECQRACPTRAVRLETGGDGTWHQGRRVLNERASGRCAACGDRFPQPQGGVETLCIPCRRGQALIQDLMMIRGAARGSCGGCSAPVPAKGETTGTTWSSDRAGAAFSRAARRWGPGRRRLPRRRA